MTNSETETQTNTLCENGNIFTITYKRVEKKEPNKNYIYINDLLYVLISKKRTNALETYEVNQVSINRKNEAVKKHLQST